VSDNQLSVVIINSLLYSNT